MKYDVESLDVKSYLEKIKRSKSLEPEKEWENPNLERMPEPEPSSPNQMIEAREMVRGKLLATMRKLDFTNEETRDQLRTEEDMWLFFTLFPQNYEFERDTLIQLWTARELIKDDHYKMLIFDSYFDALVAEGCIQLTSTCFRTGNNKYSVNVDKLNQSSAMVKSHYLRLSQTARLSEAHTELQHLSLEGDDVDQTTFDAIKKLKDLKALMFPSKTGGEIKQSTEATNIVRIPHRILPSLKHMRVLDLSGLCIANLPSSIGEMKELRYLDLSFSPIELLPETIDCLSKLQTLKLRGCSRLFRLPEGIVKLTGLKHLDLNVLGQLSFLPRGMGALTNLETLSAFIIDKDHGRGISELQKMDKLRGNLCISQLERVSSFVEASKALLSNKEYINKLELRWSEPRWKDIKVKHHEHEILTQLRPPSSLEHLEISHYGGLLFPYWFSSLHMLVSITLVRCENSKHLPSLGVLPCLNYLQLIGITKVEKIGREFRGHAAVAFPALKKLLIVGMSSLKTWEEVRAGDFPRLVSLTFERCPKLIKIPPLSQLYHLTQLELSHCAKLSSLSQLPASVTSLIIDTCSLLRKRYFRRDGKYWPEIQHVENVWIHQQEFNHAATVF